MRCTSATSEMSLADSNKPNKTFQNFIQSVTTAFVHNAIIHVLSLFHPWTQHTHIQENIMQTHEHATPAHSRKLIPAARRDWRSARSRRRDRWESNSCRDKQQDPAGACRLSVCTDHPDLQHTSIGKVLKYFQWAIIETYCSMHNQQYSHFWYL